MKNACLRRRFVFWRSGRGSPTSCGPRIRLQANPFDPRRAHALSAPETTNEKCPLARAFYVLAERTGLEPATPGVTGRYSNQLNYHSRPVAEATGSRAFYIRHCFMSSTTCGDYNRLSITPHDHG